MWTLKRTMFSGIKCVFVTIRQMFLHKKFKDFWKVTEKRFWSHVWNICVVAFSIDRHNYCVIPLIRKLLLRHSEIECVFSSTNTKSAKRPFVIQPGMSNQTGLVGLSLIKAFEYHCHWYGLMLGKQNRVQRWWNVTTGLAEVFSQNFSKRHRYHQYDVHQPVTGWKFVFLFITQYIAICPKTFSNRVWQSQTLACRKYIQWYISYLGTITVDWLWLLGGSQGTG